MKRCLISLLLTAAAGGALAQTDAFKAPAPRPADSQRAQTPAIAPAKPLTPQGPLAAPGGKKPAPAPWCEDDCRAMKSAAPAASIAQGRPKVDPKYGSPTGAAGVAARGAAAAPSARGGGDGGPTGQTEDEVYIGARNKARAMKQ